MIDLDRLLKLRDRLGQEILQVRDAIRELSEQLTNREGILRQREGAWTVINELILETECKGAEHAEANGCGGPLPR